MKKRVFFIVCCIFMTFFDPTMILKKGSFCQYYCSQRGVYLKIAERVVNADENISFDATDLVYFSFFFVYL